MPSFQDSAVIFFLALLLFGPKKLPELARQLGKLMGEFRRASSEFRLQMEDELRISEQEERHKQIAAIEAAAPKPAPTLPGADAPLASTETISNHQASSGDPMGAPGPDPLTRASDPENTIAPPASGQVDVPAAAPQPADTTLDPHPHAHLSAPAPVPIATSGELSMMPPASGLPVARNGNGSRAATSSPDLAPAFDAIPHTAAPEDTPPPDRYFRPASTPSDPQPAPTPSEPTAAQHG